MNYNKIRLQVCAPIDWREGGYGGRFDPDGSKKGLAIAEEHFAGNEKGLLDFIAALLAYYASKTAAFCPQPATCSFDLFAGRAAEIISTLDGDPTKQVELYIQLANSCMGALHHKVALKLLTAATVVQNGSRSSRLALLEARRQLHQKHYYEQCPGVLRQLIEFNEENGAVDDINRRALAAVYSGDDRFAEARSLLEPLLASRPDDGEVLALVGVTYVKEGKYPEAKPLLERAQKQNRRHAADEMAETYFQLGDLVAAAPIFRELAQSYRSQVENNC